MTDLTRVSCCGQGSILSAPTRAFKTWNGELGCTYEISASLTVQESVSRPGGEPHEWSSTQFRLPGHRGSPAFCAWSEQWRAAGRGYRRVLPGLIDKMFPPEHSRTALRHTTTHSQLTSRRA